MFFLAHCFHSSWEKTLRSISLHQPHQSLPVKLSKRGVVFPLPGGAAARSWVQLRPRRRDGRAATSAGAASLAALFVHLSKAPALFSVTSARPCRLIIFHQHPDDQVGFRRLKFMLSSFPVCHKAEPAISSWSPAYTCTSLFPICPNSPGQSQKADSAAAAGHRILPAQG